MFCGNCGKEIEDNARTCKWCGASVEDTGTTNLVVSTAFLGAGAYWLGLVNELAAFLLIGYILFKEKDVWLKAVALKAGAIIIGINILQGIFYIIEDILSGFNSFLSMVGTMPLGQTGLYQLCGFLITICGIVLDVLLLVCGYQALHYKNLKIGFLDKLISKGLKR